MSFTQLLEAMWHGMTKRFLGLFIGANRDYPYHDYKAYDDGDEPVFYQVGESNRDEHGDQFKLFVSKSTLIYSDVACTLRFNSANNVTQTIVANTWYTFESNIKAVYVVTIGTDGTLYMYFEGVLPEETRAPL